jgi:ribonuclease HI
METSLVIYRKHQADFKWDKGHNHPQNERCDELAVIFNAKAPFNRHFLRKHV